MTQRLADLFALTKSRVVVLIAFTTVVGLFMAVSGLPLEGVA